MDHTRIQKKIEHLWSLIGNTPMVELHYTYQGQHRKIYVKV
jgi:cysteine synthase A